MNIFWIYLFLFDETPPNVGKDKEEQSIQSENIVEPSEYDPKVKNTLTKKQILDIFCKTK